MEPFHLNGYYGWRTELNEADWPYSPDNLLELLSLMRDALECMKETKWKAQEVRILTYLLCASSKMNQVLVERLAELTPG